MKVLLLRSDDSHHLYLQYQLHKYHDLVGVVEESGKAQVRRLWLRGRYRDLAYALYHRARRRLCGDSVYRARYFALPTQAAVAPEVQVYKVPWINGDGVMNLLRNTPHDVVVVIGTSILKAEVLACTSKPVINLHGGFLPFYRGNHCIFFAMLEGRLDRVGSTLHLIDRGVDTGPIIERIVPPICPNDSPESIYCKAEKLAIHRLVDLLTSIQEGQAIASNPQEPGGRLFLTRSRKPFHELQFWWRNHLGPGRR